MPVMESSWPPSSASEREILTRWPSEKTVANTKRKQLLIYGALAILFIIALITPLQTRKLNNVSATTTEQEVAIIGSTPVVKHTEDRPLILYAYYEAKNARENVEFFIKHGIHDGADFIFIINGETNLTNILPNVPYVHSIKRDNSCYDLGSVSQVLQANGNYLLNKHKKFIFLNGSVRGPFLPVWSRECWSEAYLDRLTDQVKMVGISYNCRPGTDEHGEELDPHIQSMLMAVDRTGMDIMFEKAGFGTCFADWGEARKEETKLTKAILDAGYKVEALMTAFSSKEDFIKTCDTGDMLYNGRYYGSSIHPYETMFQKTNRDISPEQLAKLTEWHDGMGYSSHKVCGSQRKQRWQLVDV